MQKMLSAMSKMYPMFLMAGFGIVVIAFIIGLGNAQTAAEYFSASKVTRETTLMAQRASFEQVGIWLPQFKFLGIGLILSGIVMALRVIIDRLREVGKDVLANLAEKDRPALPSPPWYGLLMPMSMMLGVAVFVIALIVSINVGNVASALFSNPIPDIDAAGAGSALLNDLRFIKQSQAWLVPFKFLGIGLEFTAIVQGLGTIIYILKQQTSLIDHSIGTGRTSGVVELKKAA